ncbi:MAG: primosomal protein N' [SAR202 cluster bacterium]|nr:primosomal protein N' [SAR202 cluster bacterium]
MFAHVAVDFQAWRDRTFVYSVPKDFNLKVGHLVIVPFGKRFLQGLVTHLSKTSDVEQTRFIDSKVFEEPILDPMRIDLMNWVSSYYKASLFESAALMFPAGIRSNHKVVIRFVKELLADELKELTDLEKQILDFLVDTEISTSERVHELFGSGSTEAVINLEAKGVIKVEIVERRPSLRAKKIELAKLNSFFETEIIDWISDSSKFSKAPRRAEILFRLINVDEPVRVSVLRKDHGNSAVNALLKLEWLQKIDEIVERDPLANLQVFDLNEIQLTSEQLQVSQTIKAELNNNNPNRRPMLLHGVTGSGKTEIYLQSVADCLSVGKSAIVLAPEIVLTQQTIERFNSRFPGQVALLHSGLSDGERYDQWWKIRNGDAQVVVGSRSALFAPVKNLGLIILDEEHEWTYKQIDSEPRYHTRNVAKRMSEMFQCSLILGSASPDLETNYLAETGSYKKLELPTRVVSIADGSDLRVFEGSFPNVNVVDMRDELRSGNDSIFSQKLLLAIERRLSSNEKILLFLNRRGTASYSLCKSCGTSVECARCDISLTPHQSAKGSILICHYCGYRRNVQKQCPNCLKHRMDFYGPGTQNVEQEVKNLFRGVSVLRWDSDVTRRTKDYFNLLNEFRKSDSQVLVGTQMIAKGLHFPEVTLVGVILADLGLNIPDFKAPERAFQLLYQVAGRAGRGIQKGEVIIQTFQPDNYVISASSAQNYEQFYKSELELRRKNSNPPFSKLIRLSYAHVNRSRAEKESFRLSDLIRIQRDKAGFSNIEILGPTPGYPSKIRGRFKWNVVLKGPELRNFFSTIDIPQGWVVDVDPISII